MKAFKEQGEAVVVELGCATVEEHLGQGQYVEDMEEILQ